MARVNRSTSLWARAFGTDNPLNPLNYINPGSRLSPLNPENPVTAALIEAYAPTPRRLSRAPTEIPAISWPVMHAARFADDYARGIEWIEKHHGDNDAVMIELPAALRHGMDLHGILALSAPMEFPEHYALVTSPELASTVLKDSVNVSRDTFQLRFTNQIIGDYGLLSTDGEQAVADRGQLQSWFGQETMTRYLEDMHAIVETRLALLSAGEGVDIQEWIKETTLAVTLELLSGRGVPAGWTLEEILDVTDVVMFRYQALGSGPEYRRALERFTQAAEDIANLAPRPGSLLERLQAAQMPRAQIISHVKTMLMAGFYNTAANLTVGVRELGTPTGRDWQQRIYSEIRGMPPVIDKPWLLPRQTSIGPVIDETLRLHSSAWLLWRKLEAPLTTPRGQVIPAGTTMALSNHVLHTSPRFWGRTARIFDPGRFADHKENFSGRFFPFGLGKHICPGVLFHLTESSIILKALLTRFEVTTTRHGGRRVGAMIEPRGARVTLTERVPPKRRRRSP